MWVGIGVGIGRNRFATGIFNDYALRVTADGGITEAGQCVDAVTGILLNASLLLIPSGYKGGKLYAEIPTNGNGDLTWTRGSDAFRTNASGVLQRVPWNLFQYSEEFSNVAWGKVNATITSNSITAPNGTLTADTMTDNSTSGIHTTDQNGGGVGVYTFSVYAKKGTSNFVGIYSNQSAQGVYFNINTGAFSANIGNAPTSYSITNVGDGWYRCSITTTMTASGLFRILMSNDGTNFIYVGTGQTIYIWGAQLVEGTTAQTYLPTTDRLNFPRLSYMYGSCPSALLEPQRTNLALWSDDITSAVWLKVQLNTTANTTTSPDGTTNADTIAANGTNNDHTLYNLYTTTAGTAYTFSCYLKANTGRYVLLRIMTTGGTFRYGITFDLQTGTITQTSTTATAPSGTSNTITNVGNGWYRISLTLTASGTQSGVIVATSNSATPTLNANLDYVYTGSESYYLYGMQLEAGAYPTTYIPTTSATATRVADSAIKTGISSLIGQSSGTLFVSAIPNLDTSFIPNVIIRTSFSDWIAVGFIDNKVSVRIRISNAGFLILYTSTTVYTTGSIVKIALKYTSTSYNLFINGTSVSSLSTSMPSSFDTLSLNGDGSFLGIGRVLNQQIALFTTALSDTDCQTITTL